MSVRLCGVFHRRCPARAVLLVSLPHAGPVGGFGVRRVRPGSCVPVRGVRLLRPRRRGFETWFARCLHLARPAWALPGDAWPYVLSAAVRSVSALGRLFAPVLADGGRRLPRLGLRLPRAQRAAARRSTSEAAPPVRGSSGGASVPVKDSGGESVFGRRPPRPSPRTCQPSRVSVMYAPQRSP